MAADFIPTSAKGQPFLKQEAPLERMNSSCIFRRLCLRLDKVSFCSCGLFRCLQPKIIFVPFSWVVGPFTGSSRSLSK